MSLQVAGAQTHGRTMSFLPLKIGRIEGELDFELATLENWDSVYFPGNYPQR